jgi:hypothetical protein
MYLFNNVTIFRETKANVGKLFIFRQFQMTQSQ